MEKNKKEKGTINSFVRRMDLVSGKETESLIIMPDMFTVTIITMEL